MITMQYEKSRADVSPNTFGKVAVLYGGSSAEREVSLVSGARVHEVLLAEGVESRLIDTKDNLLAQLLDYAPDRAFIALHGRGGEDGTVQGLLGTLNIPYSGSGVMASALAMDKYRCKLLWSAVGLPTPEFALISNEESIEYAESLLPAFVKPSMEGSSVGVFQVNTQQELYAACETADQYNSPMLVETWIDGLEFTVSILNNQVLPAIRIEAKNAFYDYEAKYHSDQTSYHIPCGLSEAQEQELQAIALTAYETVGCSGLARVDFMQDQYGRFWLLEVNTIPGMTDHSLAPMAAKAAGLSFAGLILEILKNTV